MLLFSESPKATSPQGKGQDGPQQFRPTPQARPFLPLRKILNNLKKRIKRPVKPFDFAKAIGHVAERNFGLKRGILITERIANVIGSRNAKRLKATLHVFTFGKLRILIAYRRTDNPAQRVVIQHEIKVLALTIAHDPDFEIFTEA